MKVTAFDVMSLLCTWVADLGYTLYTIAFQGLNFEIIIIEVQYIYSLHAGV